MFYLVDKPVGPSSNQVLGHLRRYFSTDKAGHTGTLDPLASGLLIVATHGSTKLLSMLDNQSKWYEFTFDISRTSDSLDLGTPTFSLPGEHQIFVTPPAVESIGEVLQKFRWAIKQIPPKYSAISLEGKRSYREARRGVEVALPSREITVYALELLDYEFPKIKLRVHISSWGYIRSLARDIGSALNGGGVVTELRRTWISTWSLENQEFEYLELHPGEKIGVREIPYHIMFPHIGQLDLTVEEYTNIFYGNPIPRRGNFSGDRVFWNFEGTPVVLLQQKKDTLAPLRFKIS